MLAKANREIGQNVAAHDRYAAVYDALHHDEIFNPVEQERLHRSLKRAVNAVAAGSEPKRALDFGCGTGNLTRHLLDLGLHVVSADIAPQFLSMIKERFAATGRSETLPLSGEDLLDVGNAEFDLVAAYSVLHHIPDYLAAVRELIRVTKPGGVVYLDHEHNPAHWQPGPELRTFLRLVKENRVGARPRRPWLQRKILRFRRLLNPRYQPEGDIHVWPDDHVEWDRIKAVFAETNCGILVEEDYLLHKSHYPREFYEHYRTICADMRIMVARRR